MIFTQGQINSIIDLYVNQNLSCRKIAEKYQVGHGTISKLLKDNNAFDAGRPINQKYTKQDIEIIGNLYSQCDLDQIYKLYPNLNSNRLYNLMSTNGIEYGNRWSEEEIELLKNNYWLQDEELYELLNHKRSIASIATKRKKLNLIVRPMWTQDEIELLKQGYAESIDKACELLPHRSRESIRQHAKLFNLNKSVVKFNHSWSKEEDDYLRNNWEVMPDIILSSNLHRTVRAVKWRRESLGLYRQDKEDKHYKLLNKYLRRNTRQWKDNIKRQYNSTCCLSGSKDIHVHHYVSVNIIVKNILEELGLEYCDDFSMFTDEQLNIILSKFKEEQNKIGGVRISNKLHTLFHKLYGFKNTKEQFEQFTSDYKSGAYDDLLLKFA